MKVPDERLLAMFAKARVSRGRLLAVLRQMGREQLKHPDMEWSPENPTRNYCYVVSEWVHRYRLPDATPMGLRIPGDPNIHRFLHHPKLGIVDLTCDQFPDYRLVVYNRARPMPFMKTGGPQPSRRAQLLDHLYNFGRPEDFTYIGADSWG